jgi:hypothetical protein
MFAATSNILLTLGFYDKALLFARRAIELAHDQETAANMSKVLIEALIATRK